MLDRRCCPRHDNAVGDRELRQVRHHLRSHLRKSPFERGMPPAPQWRARPTTACGGWRRGASRGRRVAGAWWRKVIGSSCSGTIFEATAWGEAGADDRAERPLLIPPPPPAHEFRSLDLEPLSASSSALRLPCSPWAVFRASSEGGGASGVGHNGAKTRRAFLSFARYGLPPRRRASVSVSAPCLSWHGRGVCCEAAETCRLPQGGRHC